MKKWITAILVAVTFSVAPLTRDTIAAEIETKLNLGLGYRVDNLDWNIAGDINGNNPNILSELTWSDLKIFEAKVGGKVIVYNTLYLRGSLVYGWIFDGDNQDSDYAGDNRILEFSRSNNSAEDGTVLDTSFGVGYQFKIEADKLHIIPLVGYSYHEQNLTITEGFQTIPPTGSFPNLDSTYDTQWRGPWVGVDLLFKATERFSIFGTFEYHWADYTAEANWNLRTDLAHPKSFEHDADGTGIVASIGGDYTITDRWSINVTVDIQNWSTDAGVDKTFFANGITFDTRLNEVNWDSYSTLLEMTYRF